MLVTTPVLSTLRRMPALLFFGLFVLWVLAGIQLSPLSTSDFIHLWGTFVDFFAVGALTVHLVTTRTRLFALLDTLVFVGTCVALYGIYGYFTHQNVSVDAFSGNSRIIAIFVVSPQLALYLTIVAPVALYRSLVSRGLLRWLAAFAAIVMLAAAVLTFSRGAILAIPFLVVVVILFLPSRLSQVVLSVGSALVAAATLILAATGAVPLFTRFLGNDVGTFNGRTYLWNALLSRFDPSQVLGNGLRSSNALLTALHLGYNGDIGNGLIATAPSNLFIGVLYDQGIVGLTFILAMFAALAVAFVRSMRGANREQRMLLAVALAILAAVIVQSLEQDDLLGQTIGVVFWTVMALPLARCWQVQPEQDSQPNNPPATAHSPTSSVGLVRQRMHAGVDEELLDRADRRMKPSRWGY